MNTKIYSMTIIGVIYIAIIGILLAFCSCGTDGGALAIRNIPGPQGIQGVPGVAGVAGQNCSVNSTDTGASIVCPDGSSVDINNGTDGEDGQSAIIEIIDLCGNADKGGEVLLRLSDGNLYGVYANGQKIHFVKLIDGNYESTDQFHCKFSVENSQITYME